jgi:hypothetical protein
MNDDDPKQSLDELNAKYFVVRIKGKVRVGEMTSQGLELMTEKDFRLLEANRCYSSVGPRGGKSVNSIANIWLQCPARRTYDGIDLEPGKPKVLPGNRLNIYRGWGLDADKKGDWPLLEDHIYEVLANGDGDIGDYIIRWSAWALQNPGECAEVALVLVGDKGAGKGFFANSLCKVFGPHASHIASEGQLTGRFKTHLKDCLLLFADEAVWGGNKKGRGELQALITESPLWVELNKNLDAVEWTNRLKIIAASDSEWPMPAGKHERRFQMVRVSNRYCHGVCPDAERKAYFTSLKHELDNGGLAAFMHHLKTLDLGDWHPRQIIETEELRRVQKLGMSPREQWFYTLLDEGRLPYRIADTRDPVRTSTAALKEHAGACVPKLKDNLSDQELAEFLKPLGAVKCKVNQFRERGWWFPPLPVLRGGWEQKFGPQEWDGESIDWAAPVPNNQTTDRPPGSVSSSASVIPLKR